MICEIIIEKLNYFPSMENVWVAKKHYRTLSTFWKSVGKMRLIFEMRQTLGIKTFKVSSPRVILEISTFLKNLSF